MVHGALVARPVLQSSQVLPSVVLVVLLWLR